MNAWVIVSETFDSAHYLPNYKGKCRHLHGHTYKVEFAIRGEVDETGMVIDMSTLKTYLRDVLEKLDHGMLNDHLEAPTAENIAQWILKRVPVLPGEQKRSVRLWETPDASVYISE